MSGHSKWATTKRAKFAADAKRSAVFTKLANNISVAARTGGDPTMNFSLRMAIDKAKGANMPKDGIERAVKRGTGELSGASIEELYYEGIGPNQAQFIVKCLTDNKNRTASNIRHIFAKHGGTLSAVGWNFTKKAVAMINGESLKNLKLSQDDLELELIDAGAENIIKSDDGWIIHAPIENLQQVKQAVEKLEIEAESAEIEFIANQTETVDENAREKIEKLIEELDENEDVTDYYTNIEL